MLPALHPKDIEAVIHEPVDLVVTVCDNVKESCPIFPRAIPTLHLPFHDPHGESLESFIRVRDDITTRLLASLRSHFDMPVPQRELAIIVAMADALYITEIRQEVEGDAYFTEFNNSAWRETSREFRSQGTRQPLTYNFITYQRKR